MNKAIDRWSEELRGLFASWPTLGVFTDFAPRSIQSRSCNVRGRGSVCCPLPMQLILRLLIGQHRSHYQFTGLSLVKATRFKLDGIHTTVFVWMNSIMTPGQHRSHDYFSDLSLLKAHGVKIECIQTTVFVWMQ